MVRKITYEDVKAFIEENTYKRAVLRNIRTLLLDTKIEQHKEVIEVKDPDHWYDFVFVYKNKKIYLRKKED